MYVMYVVTRKLQYSAESFRLNEAVLENPFDLDSVFSFKILPK